MLIEFSVCNFRSFLGKQTLSMVANEHDNSLSDNLIRLSLPGLTKLRLIKVAVLYGANASGKSNLLKAISFMDWFVENCVTKLAPEDKILVEPFRLRGAENRNPTEFEVTFIADDVRYQYGFSVDAVRVHSEWLHAYPEGRLQRWFEREYNEREEEYVWDFSQKHFRGHRDALLRQTRANALFLSTAAQFGHEKLTTVYRWFRNTLRGIDLGGPLGHLDIIRTWQLLDEHDSYRTMVQDMLSYADLGIHSVDVREEVVNPDTLPRGMPPELKKLLLGASSSGMKTSRISVLHRVPGSEKTVAFDLDSESAGTVRYLSAIGPWIDSLAMGRVLAVDELGANIHPLLTRALLKLFQNPRKEERPAQAIITTHDATLLDRDMFRRDQIWLTEKDRDASTALYPLTDFHPRKDESLARGYLAGRYGAVPFLTGDLDL